MNKKWVTAGIIFVLLGLVMIFLFGYSIVEVKASHRNVEDSWKISYNYEVGENISLSIWPHADWSIPSGMEEWRELPPESGNIYDHVKVLVANITHESGNFTILKIFFVVTNPGGGAQYVTIFRDYFEVDNSKGSLEIGEGYPKAEEIEAINIIHIGKVSRSGDYTISCTLDPDMVMDRYINGSLWIHPASPPERLHIWRLANTMVSPYRNSFVLYGGATLIVFGVMLILNGVRKSGKTHRYRPIGNKLDRGTKIKISNDLFYYLFNLTP